MKSKFYYECIDCGSIFESSQLIYLCNKCRKQNNQENPLSGVLRTIYYYDEINSRLSADVFNKMEKSGFIDLLPVKSDNSLPYLKVGNTPLYKLPSLDNDILDFELYLKDESQNPTFSVKDRASAIVSASAKENNCNIIVTASAGNAGSSLAAICAAQKQKAIIIVPSKAIHTLLMQIMMYGAVTVPIDGGYETAVNLSIEVSKKFGWYNCNTAFNPLAIEGNKTISFEIFSQLNNGLPDRIFIPVGNGCVISGVYKGYEDLLNLGVIDRIPVIVAIQAIGSSNIINNINRKNFEFFPGKTIADSISTNIPGNFRMVKKYMSNYNGEGISVSDEEILAASKVLSSRTGIFAEPAASAAFAGFLSYYWDGKFEKHSKNVVLLTGSGLKDLNAVQKIIDIPSPVKPDIDAIEKILKKYF
jgi:threonine synthase